MGGGGKLIGPPPGSSSAAAASSNPPPPSSYAAAARGDVAGGGDGDNGGWRRGGARSSARDAASAERGTAAVAGNDNDDGAAASAATLSGNRRSRAGFPLQRPRGAASSSRHRHDDDAARRRDRIDPADDDDDDEGAPPAALRLDGPLPGSAQDAATRPKHQRRFSGERRGRRGKAKTDDEADSRGGGEVDAPPSTAAERQFFQQLRKERGLELYPVEGDGNCLFRAIALQVYGDEHMHGEVRERILDFMEREEDHFRNFVVADDDTEEDDQDDDENGAYHDQRNKHKPNNHKRNPDDHHHVETFQQYIARKRQNGVHGNHPEIQAASELYNRTVQVYVPSRRTPAIEPINIFHHEYRNDTDPPIRLSYHDGNHYNAIVDPNLPTAGVGLGLPGLEPGLADRMQVEKAKGESERIAVEMEEERVRWAVENSEREAEREERERVREVMKESLGFVVGAGVSGVGSSFEDEEEYDEDVEVKEALRQSALAMDDVYKKKALYLSELDAADFDLEQAVLASSLESYRKAEQERKQPSSRRGDGRRKRQNPSPTSPQRSSMNSPVHRSTATVAAAPTSSNSASVASYPRSSPTYTDTNTNYYNTDHYSTDYYGNGNHNNSDRSSHAASSSANNPNLEASTDEYPPSVQELVMNGFELSKVLHAYDLIGDNFDDLLSFLLSSAGAS